MPFSGICSSLIFVASVPLSDCFQLLPFHYHSFFFICMFIQSDLLPLCLSQSLYLSLIIPRVPSICFSLSVFSLSLIVTPSINRSSPSLSLCLCLSLPVCLFPTLYLCLSMSLCLSLPVFLQVSSPVPYLCLSMSLCPCLSLSPCLCVCFSLSLLFLLL